MTLAVELKLVRGEFLLDVALQVEPGETLALIGANGSGKSTLLAAIAGTIIPRHGQITVGRRTLTRTRHPYGQHVIVPPQHRRVGLLGQEALLFPHLTAEQNIAFGARARGETRARAKRSAGEWLEAVGLPGLRDRTPAQLSGGQQQRVALARALAAEPEVLLLDEPMAALDVQNATLMRTLLRRRLAEAELATIVVTHNIVDAMVIADRVAILDHGRLVDSGAVDTVLSQPINAFAADLIGVNRVEGVLEEDGLVRTAEGRLLAGVAHEHHESLPPVGARVAAVFAPSAVTVHGSEDPTDADERRSAAPGTWNTVIELLEPSVTGVRVLFRADSVVAEMPAHVALRSAFRADTVVSASVAREDVTIFPLRP